MRGPKMLASMTSIAVILSAAATQGSTYNWLGGSGEFSDPTRWSPSGVPGVAESVVFNSAGTVNFTGNVTNQDLLVGSYSPTFNSVFGPFTYTLARNATISAPNLLLADGPGHAINLSVGGQLSLSNCQLTSQYGSTVAAGTLAASGSNIVVSGNGGSGAMNVTGGTTLANSVLNFLPGTTGNLGGVTTLAASLPLSGSGISILHVNDMASVTAGNIVAGNSNQLSNDGFAIVSGPNAMLAQTGASTLTVGAAGNGYGKAAAWDGGTFTTGTGDIIVNATGLIEVTNGSSFNANGDIYVNPTGDTGLSLLTDKKISVDGWKSAFVQHGARSMTIGSPTSSNNAPAAPGNATVALSNQATLSTGTGVTTINKTGQLSIQGYSTFNLNGNMAIDGGRLDVNGGTFNVGTGRSVTVQHGGQMNFVGGLDISQYASYTLTTGADLSTGNSSLTIGSTTDGSLVVDGAGSSVGAGDVMLGMGGASGTLALRNGAVGHFSSIGVGGASSMSVESGSQVDLSGYASLWVGPGIGNASGTLTITGSNSRIVQNGNGLYIGGGIGFTGTDVLNVTDGGLFTSTGPALISTGGTLNIAGGTVNVSQLSTTDSGKINLTSGSLSFNNDLHVEPTGILGANVNLTSGKALSNGFAATFVAPSSKLSLSGGSLTTGTLDNSGTFSIGANSTVNISNGVYNRPGATMSLDKDAVLNAQIANSGEVVLGGGTATLGSAAFPVLTNAGVIRGDGRIPVAINNLSGGELRADFTNRLLLSGMGNTNDGQISLSFGGSVESMQGLRNNVAGVISGDGIIRTGKITYATGPVPSGTGLFNYGKMNFSGTTKVYGDVWTEGGDNCDIIVSGGASLTFYDNVYMRDTVAGSSKPEIRAGSGSRVVYFGLLKGDVNMTGSGVHSIEGTFSPGFSPGYASISNFELASSGTFKFDMAGGTRMSDTAADTTGHYSAYDISGSLTLNDGGTIDVNLVPGQAPHQTGTLFVPGVGQEFVLMTWQNLIGDPTSVTLNFDHAVLPEGLSWQASWGSASNGSLILQVVPEPASIALLAIGAGVWTLRRRRA